MYHRGSNRLNLKDKQNKNNTTAHILIKKRIDSKDKIKIQREAVQSCLELLCVGFLEVLLKSCWFFPELSSMCVQRVVDVGLS